MEVQSSPPKIVLVPAVLKEAESPISSRRKESISRMQRVAKTSAWAGLGIFRWSVYTTALLTPCLFTTLGNIGINKAARSLGISRPLVSDSEEKKDYISKYNLDPFFENFPGSSKIIETCRALGIEPEQVNKLSTSNEINDLVKLLSEKSKDNAVDIKEVLLLLDEYKTINNLTWGKDRKALDIEWLCSKSNLHPVIKFTLSEHRYNITEQHTENLKGIAKIKEYDLSNNNPEKRYITYEVRIFSGQTPQIITIKNPPNPQIENKSCEEPFVVAAANHIFLNSHQNGSVRNDLIPQTEYSNHYLINIWALSDSQLTELLEKSNKMYPAIRQSNNGKLTDGLCFVYLKDDEITTIDQYKRTHCYKDISDFRKEVKFILIEPNSINYFNLSTLIIFSFIIPICYLTRKGTLNLSSRLYANPQNTNETSTLKPDSLVIN